MKKELSQFQELLKTIHCLRGKNGCPWDQKQTDVSLKKYFIEESSELLEAIDNNDSHETCEELGDLLFLILMLCEINAEQDLFTLSDVLTTINEKLIRRHPHVFAGVPAGDEESLKKQWQAIKAKEKERKK